MSSSSNRSTFSKTMFCRKTQFNTFHHLHFLSQTNMNNFSLSRYLSSHCRKPINEGLGHVGYINRMWPFYVIYYTSVLSWQSSKYTALFVSWLWQGMWTKCKHFFQINISTGQSHRQIKLEIQLINSTNKEFYILHCMYF